MDNLVAWCIVPFDSEKRGPEERAEMLQELGFTRMAWDWRMEHIEILPEEIEALRRHDIELTAVWIWLDNNSREELLPHHDQIFNTIAAAGMETTYWVSFNDNFFRGLTDEEKVEHGARAVAMVHDRAMETGSRVALYNHMDWFGEPENQIRIIEMLDREGVGIVYNFHHGHHQISDFQRLIHMMMPYLHTVNLNGMRKDGPKILDIGSGDLEAGMIRTLQESGFRGTVGILGHTEGEDVRKVLERNLEGLRKILRQVGAGHW